MRDRERCLFQIAKLREVASGIGPAYVARSRLGRLTLSASQLAARIGKVTIPDRMVEFEFPGDAPMNVQALGQTCQRLNAQARTLMQPSEPLEDRWRFAWNQLLRDLEVLQAQIVGLAD